MHSGELARLAGVTVRALRHYHQVGVLAEPVRGPNGYRDYDVHDLIRVLRMKRLASLGIPLERMPELLDEVETDSDGLLDELDAELAVQIERLTRQRVLIARMRNDNSPLDLPPDLAPFLATFAAAGVSPKHAKIDRDQAVLLAHLAGEEGAAYLARLYELVTSPQLIAASTAISERFDTIGPDSTETEIGELIEDILRIFAPVIESLADTKAPAGFDIAESIFNEYASDTLNEQQMETLARLVEQLEALSES